jgi:hypothetical protein
MATDKWAPDCAWCSSRFTQGEELFFIDGEKICGLCASDHGYVCPSCNGLKEPQDELCYRCKRERSLL